MLPVFTLERQNKAIKREIDSAIKEVVTRGIFVLGPKVEEFQREFAKYIGVRYAVGVASGTDALSLALLSLGVTSGDEVIVPVNAYPTAFAVAAIGAIPKLVDIDPATYNIDPEKIPSAITEKTKAIIPVHLYGQPADILSIYRYIDKYRGRNGRKIYVIEDCAQAAGATLSVGTPPLSGGAEVRIKNQELRSKNEEEEKDIRKEILNTKYLILNTKKRRYQNRESDGEKTNGIGKKVGSIGDLGCFSFYPTKNLGCFGDGGMVVTNNSKIAERVRLLRMYGEKGRYNSILLGRNSRLDELQAAILLVKLKHLDEWNLRRREIAKLYTHFFVRPKKWAKERPAQSKFSDLSNLGWSGGSSAYGDAVSTLSPLGKINDRKLTRANKENIVLPIEASYVKHVYHLFVVRTERRDELKKYLLEKGIQTVIHYPVPVHLVPSFAFLGYKTGDFPESEKACGEILSLPMFPELAEREVKQVVEEIGGFYK